MEPFKKMDGLVFPLNRSNVDTDQIIPKQFLKRIERKGFGECLFYHWRFDDNGQKKSDFPLNNPKYEGASILIAGPNFGCGSSREHAPWALQDYGFKVIFAPSFADIFFNNCLKNGILAVTLPETVIASLLDTAEKEQLHLTIDLEEQLIYNQQLSIDFEIDEYQKHMLINGLDEIGLTLVHEDKIKNYELTTGR
ncbi:isopropylmalate isomerase [Heyndrickxia shackletonii]|uniref:3-isopropylmalate dehydratase small subunit n=1 Tax=Heyndrickxia shackletonii TaxID=157838 RepID=A0A0Q3WJY3_9BACI|nr:3-isopropylmalate dehydratase small subunit [Heyndrickxia shackletonii]KQL50351.1 isopropylmalate isomerase [Heyndrickxia shackletonii]MBB2479444.1 3-isopropylmalate dehydratase small subunit [Bacillus sp. APMAM]NEZ01641.1 3-isopropylmalate dehydratase small subunit [Heyndrickxia shackletonii]RTZ56985.1 3-isopropylmalate dehydratase small subunit [Bacillus sp. SAJ1]